VTPLTVFHMASIVKPFVATAILQLADERKVDLDAPVVRYLPYFRLADQRYPSITVRQMVAHTSGMPDVSDYEWDRPQFDDGALEGYVRSLSWVEFAVRAGIEVCLQQHRLRRPGRRHRQGIGREFRGLRAAADTQPAADAGTAHCCTGKSTPRC
jgi:hypothetical protein